MTGSALRIHGGELAGEIAQYRDVDRLCFMRGPEGIIIGLAEQLSLNRMEGAGAYWPSRAPLLSLIAHYGTRCPATLSARGRRKQQLCGVALTDSLGQGVES